MQDFLLALAKGLEQLFPGESWPLYYGRILQGEQRPCFYLPPPQIERRRLPCGRVRRQLKLELFFYPRRAPAAGTAAYLTQQQVGERLAQGLSQLAGSRRGYRGRGISWQPGAEYLSFCAVYSYYTTLEQEAAEGGMELEVAAAELMEHLQILGCQ